MVVVMLLLVVVMLLLVVMMMLLLVVMLLLCCCCCWGGGAPPPAPATAWSAGETSMKTSPPSLSLSHSLQSSVRISIVMQDVPVSCGANSTIVSPLGSGDSHD